MFKWIKQSIRRKVIFILIIIVLSMSIGMARLINFVVVRGDVEANNLRNYEVAGYVYHELDQDLITDLCKRTERFYESYDDIYNKSKHSYEQFIMDFSAAMEETEYIKVYSQLKDVANQYGVDNLRLVLADYNKSLLFTFIIADADIPEEYSSLLDRSSTMLRVSKLNSDLKPSDDSDPLSDIELFKRVERFNYNVESAACRIMDGPKDGHMYYLFLDTDVIISETYASFSVKVTIQFAIVVFIILALLGLHFSDRKLIRPLNSLSRATGEVVKNMSQQGSRVYVRDKVKITSGDELEELYDSIITMEEGIYEYMDELKKVTTEKERIQAELDIGKQIQAEMLPSAEPDFSNQKCFDLTAFMRPAREVGGDFYDFFMVDEHKLAFMIADVSGKGVPAALVMAIGKSIMKSTLMRRKQLSVSMGIVNNYLIDSNRESMFITSFAAILDLENGELTYCNAGHPFPFVIHADGKIDLIKDQPVIALGLLKDREYVEKKRTIRPGDRIFLFTDGVTEAQDSEGTLFGESRCREVLESMQQYTTTDIVEGMIQNIDAFADREPQFDDITMLCLEFRDYTS